MPKLITLTIEGFATGLVGAYGANTAITSSIDSLAARGLVLDQCFLDSRDLESQLSSLATCCHALQPTSGQPNLWHRLQVLDIPNVFVTDSTRAANWAEQAGCQQVLLIEPAHSSQPVRDPSESAALGLFTAAASVLEEQRDGLVWLHSLGFQLPWDAPLSLREQFIDPEDPQPPAEVGPPCLETSGLDPDLVTGWGQVAAAQAAILDGGIGSLLALLEVGQSANDCAWLIVGLGGVPLGEHGHVGWNRPQLHAEELQCLVILRPSPPAAVGWRRAELCQLPDVGATLWDCLGCLPAAAGHWGKSMLPWCISDTPARWSNAHKLAMLRSTDNRVWIRSPAWSGVLPAEACTPADSQSSLDPTEFPVQLFAKPDDRWEVSEVAARCPDVVQQLRTHAGQFLQAAAKHDRSALLPVDDGLCDLMR